MPGPAMIPAPQYRINYDAIKPHLKPAFAKKLEAEYLGPGNHPVGGSIGSAVFKASVSNLAIDAKAKAALKQLSIKTIGELKSQTLRFNDPLHQISARTRTVLRTIAAAAKT